jgi:hypothetical protein
MGYDASLSRVPSVAAPDDSTTTLPQIPRFVRPTVTDPIFAASCSDVYSVLLDENAHYLTDMDGNHEPLGRRIVLPCSEPYPVAFIASLKDNPPN